MKGIFKGKGLKAYWALIKDKLYYLWLYNPKDNRKRGRGKLFNTLKSFVLTVTIYFYLVFAHLSEGFNLNHGFSKALKPSTG